VKIIDSLVLLLLPTVLLGGVPSAFGAAQDPASRSSPPLMVCSAADGIFAVFQSHPLVGLADYHGLAHRGFKQMEARTRQLGKRSPSYLRRQVLALKERRAW